MSITHLQSVNQLNSLIKSKDKVSVIDFHATWCGPCHAIAPAFESFSKQYTNVNFFKCDVDQAREVASLYSVSAMPTFVFLRGSTKIDQVRGANKAGLESAIRKHSSASSTSSTSAFSGKGQTLGGSNANGSSKGAGDFVADVREGAGSMVSSIDPQVKVLLYLLVAYGLFWYLS